MRSSKTPKAEKPDPSSLRVSSISFEFSSSFEFSRGKEKNFFEKKSFSFPRTPFLFSKNFEKGEGDFFVWVGGQGRKGWNFFAVLFIKIHNFLLTSGSDGYIIYAY